MFWSTFKLLCDENHISPSAALVKLGLSKSLVTSWKNGTLPDCKTIVKLSEFFNVTADYLLTGEVDTVMERLKEATEGFTDQQLDELIAYAQFIRARDKK